MPERDRSPREVVTRDDFDAVIFDLDGVLTDTAGLHAKCWKIVFDAVLQDQANMTAKEFRPFDLNADYRVYVDGKARLDGVRDFLASRAIQLPEGSPQTPLNEDSVYGIAKRKDNLFSQQMVADGVKVFEGSRRWLQELRESGLQTAVASASHHCIEVLRAAGLSDCFDVHIDGNIADRLGLAGKPAPDIFLAAARELGVSPDRSVVVEDALSGVQAGYTGGFGLVVGVVRHGNAAEMAAAGASIVVGDLSEMLR